ncbi:hypothetical protein AVEN_177906-1 [Araneus ventricosus]|uniref:Uncharacterized protein n=1 Tax=Araneus ventricosus TaxID=182803 RepID=A0A4Y2RND2_ARAVE|nr:hypothetical protein AVEN_177906-1 [Araneus ventricosus]
MLGWKIGIRCARKLRFKDHKRKISRDFPDNEVARSFMSTCLVLTICLRACRYWVVISAFLFILQLIRGSRSVLKPHIFVAYFKTSDIPCGAHATKLRATSLSGKS